MRAEQLGERVAGPRQQLKQKLHPQLALTSAPRSFKPASICLFELQPSPNTGCQTQQQRQRRQQGVLSVIVATLRWGISVKL